MVKRVDEEKFRADEEAAGKARQAAAVKEFEENLLKGDLPLGPDGKPIEGKSAGRAAKVDEEMDAESRQSYRTRAVESAKK